MLKLIGYCAGKINLIISSNKKWLITPSLLFGIHLLVFSASPNGKIIYTFPVNEGKYVLPDANVIVRFKSIPVFTEDEFNNIFKVRGKTGGEYTGKVKLLSNRNTVIWESANQFKAGDTVLVSFNSEIIKTNIPGIRFSVAKRTVNNIVVKQVEEEQHIEKMSDTKAANTGTPRLINGVAVPADFPAFTPWINKEDKTADGYLFLQNWEGAPYIMILENDGTPFFYRKVEERSRDFKVQPTGQLSRLVRPGGLHHQIMDKNYNHVRYVYAQNGYVTDEHELQLTTDGTALIIANDQQFVDMSALVTGGRENARVTGNNIQEIDENGNVIFQWNCWDYYNIEDAIYEDLTNSSIDFVHMNSIAIDYDDHIVVSSRHLNEITKIDRKTGNIIWRFGGLYNDFTLVNDEDGISYQHDCRPLEGKPNHYTIFDNGNTKDPRYSRAVEFHLDPETWTATKIWEYRYEGDWSFYMGNAQRQENGNTFINWGKSGMPKATEVTPDGEVVYEGDFENGTASYRAFRFKWDGMLLAPELILEPYPNQIHLIFNKFGDGEVMGYNVYVDQQPDPATLFESTTNNYLVIDEGLENNQRYYFKVKAFYSDNSESPASNIQNTVVSFTQPGQNIIRNSDFSDGDNEWNLNVDNQASASGFVNGDEKYYFNIIDEGAAYHHIQLEQRNIPLIYGTDYIFQFDAMAETPRTIEIKVARASNPWTNYSKIGLTYITQNMQTFTYPFTMTDATDFSARVVVNCGDVEGNVTVDNFVLREDVEVSIDDKNTDKLTKCELVSTYFKDNQLQLTFNESVKDNVNITIFNIKGQEIKNKTIPSPTNGNTYHINFATNTKGVYFLRIISNNNKKKQYHVSLFY